MTIAFGAPIDELCCCLPNFGRCGRNQDRVSVNCPLVKTALSGWMDG